MFSVWRLAWVAHQLTADPSRLFDTNIFWPQTNTLAYSDAMLLLGMAGAPFIWAGVHPIAVHNILVLGAFVTAALGAAYLMRYFTPSRPAQVIAGIIFAFAPYRFAHIGHLELLWTAFLPLSLLGVYRMLEQPTLRRGAAFGLAVGLQALCSVYYFVFLVIWLVPATLLAPLHVRIQWSRGHLAAGAIAVCTAAVLVAPYVAPYSRARADLPPRSETEVHRYSAVATDYLRASDANRIHPAFESESPEERSLFVGVIALTLAAIAVILVRTPAAVTLLLLGLAAADSSLGVNGLTYNLLRETIAPLAGLRAPARFAVLVLLSVALLAGLGLSQLLSRATSRRKRLVTAALVAGLAVEYWSTPITTRQLPTTPPPVYAWLAGEPHRVLLELPVPTPESLWLNETSYQFFSIYHWQTLANGYSGYAPASYVRMLEVMRDFPSESSVQFLRAQGVDLVVFHRHFLAADEFERLLEGCRNQEWFSEVVTFEWVMEQDSIACRVSL